MSDGNENALDLVDDVLDLIVARGASIVEVITAMSNLMVALSIMLARTNPEADAVVGLSALTRTMVERVKDATGRTVGTA